MAKAGVTSNAYEHQSKSIAHPQSSSMGVNELLELPGIGFPHKQPFTGQNKPVLGWKTGTQKVNGPKIMNIGQGINLNVSHSHSRVGIVGGTL